MDLEKIGEKFLVAGLFVYVVFAAMSISGLTAGILLGVVGWIFSIFCKKKFIYVELDKKTKVFILFILIFLFIFIISSIFSKVPLKSFDRLRTISLEIVLFFLVTVTITNDKLVKKLFIVLIVFASISSIYGIIQYFTGFDLFNDPQIVKFGRVKGSLAHWNKLGSMLGMIIPISVGLILSSKKKMLYVIGTILMLMCLCFTFTRGAWIGTVLALVMISILKEKRLLYLIIPSVVILLTVVPPIRERVVKTFTHIDYERIIMWESAIKMFKDRPILGQGPNTFESIFYYEFLDEEKRVFFDGPLGYSHPHNMYLGILGDMGILGIISFLSILVYVMFTTYKTFLIVENGYYKYLSLGILGSFIDFTVHGMVEYVFSAEPGCFFWFLSGIIFYVHRKIKG